MYPKETPVTPWMNKLMHQKVSQLRWILESVRSSRYPLIFVICGSGHIARYAIDGGAHFIMVLNAGLYRMAGVSSLGSFLPFGNANDQTEELLRTQILPRSKEIPVVAGVLCNDPIMPTSDRLKRLMDLGVSGVTNWPSVGLVDGNYRNALIEENFTVTAEVEMLLEAKRMGFVPFGFVFSGPDAALMADAGIDVLILNLGWTHETYDIHEKRDRIQYSVVKINEMLEAVHGTGKDPICLYYGGAITTPEDTAELYKRTKVHGYGGGSAFERIPIAKLVTNTVKQFCSVPRQADSRLTGDGMGELVGASPAMSKLYKLIERVAPYDVNVCIEGETGVGKELVATQIHLLSHRASQPFITLNCGAIPDTLIESEFFGHEKGAFTGAVRRKLGKFELADRGTLFLDEVAELSPKAQVSLLRVLQKKEISRVGGEKAISIDVRIISATHQDLKKLVNEGKFRADLYFRLNMITLKIPPLRSRKEDIPALVDRFLAELSWQFGRNVIGVTPDFMDRLMKHSWPGNVRELRHVLCRAILLEDEPVLKGEDFVPELVLSTRDFSREILSDDLLVKTEEMDMESHLISNALRATGGNKSKAAALLGISRKTLYAKLRKLNRYKNF
jgi:two-component system response regulator HydG